MDVNVNVNVPAIEKLVDYTASGVGSIAGSMLAPWQARREARAKRIAAEGGAKVLLIQAKAQSEAREILVSDATNLMGELDITDRVNQRISFQDKKRQLNIESVVGETAMQLGDKSVPNTEPDHDWTARFFNDVQDVSSEDMQSLWAKILAGEIERPGSTSIRTLGILKNLDQFTACLFRTFCSACIFLSPDENTIIDARVSSLGENAAQNSLSSYGLSFGRLNRLNEHGLIISDYNSWFDFRLSIGISLGNLSPIPFNFQGRRWVLVSEKENERKKPYKLSGVAMTISGIELSKIIELEPMTQYVQDLIKYFQNNKLQMVEVNASPTQPGDAKGLEG